MKVGQVGDSFPIILGMFTPLPILVNEGFLWLPSWMYSPTLGGVDMAEKSEARDRSLIYTSMG